MKSLVEKTGEVLDTMLAGRVVGAVTGAAQSLSQEPTAVTGVDVSTAKAESPGTGEVLGEMAPGAALGAVSGVAKAVLPTEKAKGTKKKSSKTLSGLTACRSDDDHPDRLKA